MLLSACTANFVTELHALPDAQAFASELPSSSARWSGDDTRGRATLHLECIERVLKHLQSAAHALEPHALCGLLQLQMAELARGLPQLHTRRREQPGYLPFLAKSQPSHTLHQPFTHPT